MAILKRSAGRMVEESAGGVGPGHSGHVTASADVTRPFVGWVAQLAATFAGPSGAEEVAKEGAARLVDVLADLERVKAACAAAQARVTAAFVETQAAQAAQWRQAAKDSDSFEAFQAARDQARRCEFQPVALNHRHDRGETRRDRGAYDRAGVAAQIGLARHESPARGARLTTTALALTRDLPFTLTALESGALNERRAELVAKLTSHLAPEQRTHVDAEVIAANLPDPDGSAGAADPGIAAWGDRRLEAEVRAAADRIDAQAAVKRARTAESERRVTIRPIPDTMAIVTAILPVAQAVAVQAALMRAAATAHATGDLRSRGQVMADTLVHRVTHPTPLPTPCTAVTTQASDLPGPATAGLPADVSVEIQLVITDRALLAGDDTPAHIPGYGPIPAGWARDLLTADLIDEPPPDEPGHESRQDYERRRAKIYLRRLYTHPRSGTLVAMDSKRRLFPAGLRRFLIARDGTCRTPWCDAPIRHADHVTPHAAGGPTSAANGQGLCQRCNHVKDLPGWYSNVLHAGPTATTTAQTTHRAGDDAGKPHTVQLTTPTGHGHISSAPSVLPGHTPSTQKAIDEAPADPDQRRRNILSEHGFQIQRIAA
ncbi:MAG TPA: DUF222 domain-containing protein [Intrasporangium sp.]|uniref:HNH endonuclease n=1 Tax=Intrasporangium sp. TaxID=1925024 RepID=UPI002F9395A3